MFQPTRRDQTPLTSTQAGPCGAGRAEWPGLGGRERWVGHWGNGGWHWEAAERSAAKAGMEAYRVMTKQAAFWADLKSRKEQRRIIIQQKGETNRIKYKTNVMDTKT